MSDAVQIASIILAFLSTVFSGVLAYLMARLKAQQEQAASDSAERGRQTAVAVATVKNTLQAENAVQTAKLEEVANKVEIVHKATNSLTDALVAATDRAARSEGTEAGRQQGIQEESDRSQKRGPQT